MAPLWSAVIAAVVSLVVAAGGWVMQSRRLREDREEAAQQRAHELQTLKEVGEQERQKLREEAAQQRAAAEYDAQMGRAAERREQDLAKIRYILREDPQFKFRSLPAIQKRLGSNYTPTELRELLSDAGALASQTNTGSDRTDSYYMPE